MEDTLVTFDTAKLAKEKSFNEICDILYGGTGDEKLFTEKCVNKNSDLNKNREWYSVPTQSLLQKWLREAHNIDVWAQPFVRNQSLPDESYSYFVYKDGVWQTDGVDMLDFEEALEKALQEALKLI